MEFLTNVVGMFLGIAAFEALKALLRRLVPVEGKR